MAKTISFSLQKGGVGKTTTAGICSWLLSHEWNYRVLAVDVDSQGNLTQMLTHRDIYDFSGHTILEGIKELNVKPYIINVENNLDIVPAEDLLSTLSRFIYTEYKGNTPPGLLLRKSLESVQSMYDFIILDLPPNLGEQTSNALGASDYVVVMFQSEPFSHNALDRMMEFLFAAIKPQLNSNLVVAGILPTMLDSRASIDHALLDDVRKEYEELVFNTIIRRRTRIKEFAATGIQNKTKIDRDALETHVSFVKELLIRVES